MTASDEAFVWQVMTFYYPIWVQERQDDALLCKKSGPKKGFKQTTGKTVKVFQSYVQAVGRSRSARNSNLWSGRLKYLVHKKEKEDREKEILEEKSNMMCTIEVNQDMGFLQYAKLRMDGFDKEGEEDSHDDTNMDETADSTLTEEI